MRVSEREMRLEASGTEGLRLDELADQVGAQLRPDEAPVRFVVTASDHDIFRCELAVAQGTDARHAMPSVFTFRQREYESVENFTSVLLVPTGIGAEIGGHSGDAGPIARLLATVCDTLITHPNVVNGADINELPENGLYVEGSVITRLLMGTVGLQRVRGNRILLVVDRHPDRRFRNDVVNAASAARAAMGVECPLIVELDGRMTMRSSYSNSGRAAGRIDGLEHLFSLLEEHRREFDAVALSTLIEVPEQYHAEYFAPGNEDMVNPWGGVEAMLTHAVSLAFDVPSAHAPMMSSAAVMNLDLGVVDPRKSAEAVSRTYLHSVLKGMHRSPRIVPEPPLGSSGLLTASDVSCLVIPSGCLGLPMLAAFEQGIPIIEVRENRNRMDNDLSRLSCGANRHFVVESYLEAVGVIAALRGGVAVDSVRRPLAGTRCGAGVEGSGSEAGGTAKG